MDCDHLRFVRKESREQQNKNAKQQGADGGSITRHEGLPDMDEKTNGQCYGDNTDATGRKDITAGDQYPPDKTPYKKCTEEAEIIVRLSRDRKTKGPKSGRHEDVCQAEVLL